MKFFKKYSKSKNQNLNLKTKNQKPKAENQKPKSKNQKLKSKNQKLKLKTTETIITLVLPSLLMNGKRHFITTWLTNLDLGFRVNG